MLLYILTGETGTGKSTRLMHWCEKHADIAGIVTPVIAEKRFFHDIKSGEIRKMEADPDEADVQSVGKFVFSVAAFAWAENVLRQAIHDHPEFIVIDEIGPLELQGKGFHNILEEMLNSNIKKVLLVVRRSKVDEVIASYNLRNVRIIEDVP